MEMLYVTGHDQKRYDTLVNSGTMEKKYELVAEKLARFEDMQKTGGAAKRKAGRPPKAKKKRG